jgi:hypothetical protein
LLKASQTNKAPSVTTKIATDAASVKEALDRFPNLKRFS